MENFDKEAIQKLKAEVAILTEELETYKTKSPIVGVRWYGAGGFGIGLTRMVGGVNKVALEGYGAKAVIDHSAWIRVRNTEEVQNGILVRDDSVIEEMDLPGKKATLDQNKSKNSFTREEIIEILKGPVSEIKKILRETTHYFPARHFYLVATEIGIDNESKLKIIKDKYDEMVVRFKYEKLHHHDLCIALDNLRLPWEHKSDSEMIEILVNKELTNRE